MAKSRFTGNYGRWRKRRLWRIRRIRQMKERRAGSLRRSLLLVLTAELGFGGWHFLASADHEIRLIRFEEEYQVEWQMNGNRTNSASDQIYGVRLNPRKLELELYHREPAEEKK